MKRVLSRLLAIPLFGLLVLPALACSAGTKETRTVTMALDGSNDRPRTQFYPDTNIFYCNAEVVGQKRDTTVQIFIRQIKAEQGWGGPLVDSNYLLVGGEFVPPPGASIVSLGIDHPKPPKDVQTDTVLPYPVGEFRCEVVVNGVLQDVEPFKIIYAPCPGLAAVPGAGCQEIYPPNSKCPAIDQKITCTCGATSGVWEC
ncbi:hypothetical protein BH09MYX1_BH09MYX1_59240 [soil metagenome]